MSETVQSAPSVEKELNLGTQPLDATMLELELINHDVVALCPEGLTHKAMQRARKGRRLTPKMKERITETLNLLSRNRSLERQFRVKDLFNY
ncbi:MAG: hypothetical protein ACAI34_24240 [Verrucomicrobium sp.]|nr:hypothetical protein [Verrucomicrobium sp.]